MFDIFDACGFGDVARPMISIGVDFESVSQLETFNPGSGNDVPSLSANLLPGVIILVLHFTAVGLTAGNLVFPSQSWNDFNKPKLCLKIST